MQKFSFLKATIVGGLVFLLPLVFIVLIIGKALKISMVVAEPLGRLIPIDQVGGIRCGRSSWGAMGRSEVLSTYEVSA